MLPRKLNDTRSQLNHVRRATSNFLAAISTIIAFQLLSFPCWASDVPEDDAYFRALVAERYVAPFQNGDIDTWILNFDENAVALHNRRPIDRGRNAIEAFGLMVHKYFELEQYEVQVTDIRRSQDWVYTVGMFTTLFVSREDRSTPFGREQGKFLLLWERQEDNSWKIILDMGNSNQQSAISNQQSASYF